jgi:hypothetical protein
VKAPPSILSPYFAGNAPVEIVRADALAGSEGPKKAYDSLLEALVRAPNTDLEQKLEEYGSKLGLTPEQANNDLWNSRYETAQVMKDFSLTSYDGKTEKLSELRGKIVLVNFFYPT